MPDFPGSQLSFGPNQVLIRIGARDGNQRLDRFLRKLLPGAKLGFLYKSIDRGRIRLNQEKSRPGTVLKAGDEVSLPFARSRWDQLSLPLSRPDRQFQNQTPSLEGILFEDEDILAVDKPASQATHGGESSLTNAVKAYLGPLPGALTFRVAPVHRLNRGTSGVVLFGKNPEAQRALAASFRRREVSKIYYALVSGKSCSDRVIRSFLERLDRAQGPKVRAVTEGMAAETHVRVLATSQKTSLLELRPETGRTHQLRAQLADLNSPILGDPRYGLKADRSLCRHLGLERMFLHAARLRIPHPDGNELLEIEALFPPDLWAILGKLGFQKFLRKA